MIPETVNAEGGTSASREYCSLRQSENIPDHAPKEHVAQAKINLLSDEIYHSASALSHTLDVLFAGYEANDIAVQIHALRQSRRYWRFIAALAQELVAADAERLSALRQEGARQ